MPLSFVHVYDDRSELDMDGTNLPDANAARRTALQYVREIQNDLAYRKVLGNNWYMEVADTSGLIYLRFDFHLTNSPVRRDDNGKRRG